MDKIISVVVPTWKRPSLLLRCLDALAAQTLRAAKYEIIVVTDGPDPVTMKAVKHWSRSHLCTVTCTALSKKSGPAAARNKGWRMASSQLIAFTDDDCVPDRNWLKAIVHNYNGKEKIAFTGRLIVPLSDEPTDHELNTFNLERAEFITANCAATKAALEATGGFDERFTLAWREDSDLEFKFLEAGIGIIKLKKAIVVHPARPAPWGYSMKEQKKGMFNALLYKKYPALYQSKIAERPPLLYYGILASFILLTCGIMIRHSAIAITACVAWLALVAYFTSRRLSATSHSPGHVGEMIFTSMVIPFLSVYWHFYGMIKYKSALI